MVRHRRPGRRTHPERMLRAAIAVLLADSARAAWTCPEGWVHLESAELRINKCYQEARKRSDKWCDEVCPALGEEAGIAATPVCIESARENTFIVNYFPGDLCKCSAAKDDYSGCHFIGLRQKIGASEPDGGWEWGHARWNCRSEYFNWKDGEPNNYGGHEACVVYNIHGDDEGYWADYPCGDEGVCVCEGEPFAAPGANVSAPPAAPPPNLKCPYGDCDFDKGGDECVWDPHEKWRARAGGIVGIICLCIAASCLAGICVGVLNWRRRRQRAAWARTLPRGPMHGQAVQMSSARMSASAMALPLAVAQPVCVPMAQAVAVQPDGGNPPIVQATPIDGAAVSAAPAEGVPIGVKCGAPSSSRLSR